MPPRADIAPSQRLLRSLRRAIGWPARRVLDQRVRWTVNEVEERLDVLRLAMHARLDRIETLAEEALRAAPEHPSKLAEEDLQAPAPLQLERLHLNLARLIDLASGPHGFAAQAGLWFNPPIALEHRPGEVRVAQVNERIVEQPFAFRALGDLPPGARVLDIGGAESQVALGCEVTVVDPRGYPIDHPRLTTVAAPSISCPPSTATSTPRWRSPRWSTSASGTTAMPPSPLAAWTSRRWPTRANAFDREASWC